MEQYRWTKEQTIVAFNLYCKIPFNKVVSNHPDIIRIAKIIGRSANSVKMKIGNFGSFDPELKKRGIVGLSNTSKLDEEVWDEFNSNWDKLAYESEILIAKFNNQNIEEYIEKVDETNFPTGKERAVTIKQRVNQYFFRNTILSAYNNSCCITGINIPTLLIASHIIPWSIDEKLRLNPHNGLCLNAIHDKAFDRGLISITPDYDIKISKQLLNEKSNEVIKNIFINYQNIKIKIPERFIPEKEYLDYHYSEIFEKY
jgi:putative restriction endonuclease